MAGTIRSLVSTVHTRIKDFAYAPVLDAYVEVFQSDDGVQIHRIVCNEAPGANFNNAPNGSEYWDGVNFNFYRKSGTPGLADGVWKVEALT